MIRFLPNSLIDYPGKAAAVLFLQGCNLRCQFCHNPELALAKAFSDSELERETQPFLRFLSERKGLIDGVVISGGETTIYGYLLNNLCREIKSLGYLIKIDTNGTRPDVLKELIEKKLIDYVAVSLKPHIAADISESIYSETLDLLVKSGIQYEVRVVAVSQKADEIKSEIRKQRGLKPIWLFFDQWLKENTIILKFFGVEKLKLHRHNKSAKILNPAFYDGVKMFDESDYQRLADIVRSQGLECEVV